MIQIRPVSNLRNQFIDIEKRLEKETRYFTKNGYGTMVVLSLEASSRLTDGVESVLAEADRYFSDFSWYVELKFKISGSPIEPSQVFFFEMIASSVSIATKPGDFKRVCCMLRGQMREMSLSDNAEGFQFVLTSPDTLSKIVLWYRNKYNDDTAVKESVAELNCAYGVENDKVFLTARNSEADSYSHRASDRCWFVAIMKQTGEVLEFRCKREAEDGSFVADYHSGSSKENWVLISSAVEYYRNRQERKVFFDAYSAEHDATIEDLMKSSHKGLLSKFKRHYEKEYKRIKGNPLDQILLKIVDLCEEKGPVYGYKNTVIAKPANQDEITAWEKEQGIFLPDSYKDFLKFANGVQFFGSSEYIAGLQGLKTSEDYVGADYILLGEMIGDGTMICISKSDGHVYIADHGEYEDKGDFAEFLEYLLDFLEGI